MNWKFWQKNNAAPGEGRSMAKESKPKELPSHIGMHLVVKEKYDPDWVWELKMIKSPREGSGSLYDFRIFNPTDVLAAGVRVTGYDALALHDELILFHGYSDKHGDVFHIEKGVVDQAA